MNANTNTLTAEIDQETFWQAVETRDARLTGVFVYAVRSTGIYCQPSCPSRRPRREQVVFFTTCDEAEAAGFRACRRCHPREALTQNTQAELIQHACQLMDDHIEEPYSLEELSRQLNLSPSHFHRLFKSMTGLTPRQYAAGQRLNQFKVQVKNGGDVTTALYEAGYSSSSRLYEGAAGKLGMTPASYRKGGAGMKIQYTIVDSYLGRMLIAATEHGICAVSFADQDASLDAFLQSEYPAAQIQRSDTALKQWVQPLVHHLEGTQTRLALPLDLQATAFQLRVWEELRKIPYGETRTYTQVAAAIGRPKAVRAVANACASNPAVIITPCHRVVRSDGSLGGYRYGMQRKQALLARERSERSERSQEAK